LSDPRLRLLHPEELDASQRALYEAVAGGPRAGGPFRLVDDDGRLLGPFNAMLYAPGIGSALQALGSALRFDGGLPARTRELVICAVAAHWDSEYEWYAHSRVARTVGITDAELDDVRAGRVPAGARDPERAALRLARARLADRRVDDDVHADAVRHHGEPGVVELAVLVGYYQALAGLLATEAVSAPEDEAEERTAG
jgi:alkylhydroperoxidase family enzyme